MKDYILRKSLNENQIIKIIYIKDDTITTRNIKVKEISEDKIKAYCYLRRGIRFFNIENILSVKLLKNRS